MKEYGILANPAKHSLSPVIHNAAFKALHIDAEYKIFEKRKIDLPVFFKHVIEKPISGLSVSLPYKEEVMQYLQYIDVDAAKIGAVNTVINKKGVLYGDNTDFIGCTNALKEELGEIKGKKAVIIGGGGAARAIAYGLLKEGVNVQILNRTKKKADRIAIEFAEMFKAEIHSGYIDDLVSGDILINASSLWFSNEEHLCDGKTPDFMDYEFIDIFDTVMDITYNIPGAKDPLITPLLAMAQAIKKKIVTGDKMLLHQAIAQFEMWTEKKAPVVVMRKSLSKALKV